MYLRLRLISPIIILLSFLISLATADSQQAASRADLYIITPPGPEKVYNAKENVRVLVKADITAATINGIPINTKPREISGVEVPLRYGKQFITVAYTKNGERHEVSQAILRLPRFDDVQEGRWSKDIVEYLAALGLYWGDNMPQIFKPKENLLFRDLAEIIAKYQRLKTGAVIDKRDAHTGLSDIATSLGYPAEVSPYTKVNRALAGAVITYLADIKPEKVSANIFVDVPTANWYAPLLHAAYQAGLITGANTPEGIMYYPDKLVNREGFLTMLRSLVDAEVQALKL